jgi:hypothetical protein
MRKKGPGDSRRKTTGDGRKKGLHPKKDDFNPI